VITLSRGELSGRIPVINLAPAGQPADYVEMYPDSGIGNAYIDPSPGIAGPNLFAFVIVGDSMAMIHQIGERYGDEVSENLAAISLVMSSRSFNLGCMRFELPIAGDEQSKR
jgi:hypothetical protein